MTASDHWLAIAISSELRTRPMPVVVDGERLVLFREGGRVRCLADRCPHRHAPLSGGSVVGGTLQCPYHGWRFDGAGSCVEMPGLCGDLPRVRVPARRVREAGGLMFLARGEPSGDPYVCSLPEAGRHAAFFASSVSSSLVDVAENVLDATHTHFTHKGLLRGLTTARHRVEVTVTRSELAVEARYEGEPSQDGIVSRLLEGGRTVSYGRFLAPCVAELEFHGPGGPNLVSTFHLREAEPGVVAGIAVLAAPTSGILGRLKAALFMPLFKIAYRQDRRILETCAENRRAFGDPEAARSPLDVLRSDIETLASGGTLAPGACREFMSL